MSHATEKIRALNDAFRRHLTGGTAVMTPGIAALGPEAVARIIQTIATYDTFCRANDPYEEHDFGVFEAEGTRVFWKIDYFDRERCFHAPDPADPEVTERVITVMLAEEYLALGRDVALPGFLGTATALASNIFAGVVFRDRAIRASTEIVMLRCDLST